jgi:hypothetical protein
VRFTVESGDARASAVAFGCSGRLPVREGAPAEATFALELNEWQGVTEPRLVLRRARPASAPATTEQPVPAATGQPVRRATEQAARAADAFAQPQAVEELVLFSMP